jgi:hypothetical protein
MDAGIAPRLVSFPRRGSAFTAASDVGTARSCGLTVARTARFSTARGWLSTHVEVTSQVIDC